MFISLLVHMHRTDNWEFNFPAVIYVLMRCGITRHPLRTLFFFLYDNVAIKMIENYSWE